MRKILSAFLFLLCSGAAFAHSYTQGGIAIGHIWTRATPSGATTAAVYGPFVNNGKETDRLTGASSEWADKIEIHRNVEENGITRMEKMDFLTLEPGKPVALKPGGMHLMVIGLRHPLKEGGMFPLTLQFEKAGAAKAEAKIEAPGATAPGIMAEHNH